MANRQCHDLTRVAQSELTPPRMRSITRSVVKCTGIGIVSLALSCILPFSVSSLAAPEVAGRPAYTQLGYAQIDQLVAPIALYPDALVAQVLVAATYSPQVVEADRFVRAHAGMSPQQLAALVNSQPWDPSVRALTAFPSVLSNMNRNLSWTTQLGNAYYNQPQDVMGAVQAMRQRAYAAGTLRSTPQQIVTYQPGNIVIAPPTTAVYYVPMYNPWVVYGAPVAVYPAYYYVAPPPPPGGIVVAAAVGFSAGVAVGAFSPYTWGCTHWAPNWHAHVVVYNRGVYVSRSITVVNRGYYGGYDHAAAARSFNHQAFVTANGGVATRNVVRGNGQTNVWGHGPNGGTYERSTTHYPGGSTTSFTGPGGQTATRTVTGRGTGDVTSTVVGPNGGTTTRETQRYPGGGTTTVTGPHGGSETTSVYGLGTGHAGVTRSGARGNGTWPRR